MKYFKLTIHPSSHTMDRLKERMSISDEPEEVIRRLNQNFDAGVYQERRRRIYVAPLGYFGIMPDRKQWGKHFCMTYYKGLAPFDAPINANLEWFLAD
jgi:hypothetical protein